MDGCGPGFAEQIDLNHFKTYGRSFSALWREDTGESWGEARICYQYRTRHVALSMSKVAPAPHQAQPRPVPLFTVGTKCGWKLNVFRHSKSAAGKNDSAKFKNRAHTTYVTLENLATSNIQKLSQRASRCEKNRSITDDAPILKKHNTPEYVLCCLKDFNAGFVQFSKSSKSSNMMDASRREPRS